MQVLSQRLYEAIAAVCPILGVSVGDRNDKTTWRVSFGPSATAQQKAAAQSVMAGLDANAPDDPLDKYDVISFKIEFNHENRVRALEGKPAITANQFAITLKAML